MYGRFLQTDPIGADDDLNLYAYVGGDPVNASDTEGTQRARVFVPWGAPLAVNVPGTPEYARAAEELHYIVTLPWVGVKAFVSDVGRLFNIAPPLPGELVGENPRPGRSGTRWVSGPMAPEHGGTGDPDRDFDKLTGGTGQPNEEGGRPPGTRVGGNGVQYRPGGKPGEVDIDIPANGDKPKETLHYPPTAPDAGEREIQRRNIEQDKLLGRNY